MAGLTNSSIIVEGGTKGGKDKIESDALFSVVIGSLLINQYNPNNAVSAGWCQFRFYRKPNKIIDGMKFLVIPEWMKS